MSFVKSRGSVRMLLVALAMLLASSQTARAETIFLTCTGEGNPITFTVDLTNNTVDNLPAAIDATSIDWQKTYTPEGGKPCDIAGEKNHIDRTSGTFKRIATIHFCNGVEKELGPIPLMTCTKGSAPVTQF
jgi:hypothetical protein